jgi:hypothetical protein
MDDEETFDPLHVLAELHARHVRYVLVGDLAAMAHGSTLTADRVEVCVADDEEDFARLGTLLQLLDAEQDESAGDPHRVVFHTAAGRVDCVEVPSAEDYAELEARATDMTLAHGVIVHVASPEDVAVQQLASDDLIGAVRTTALGEDHRVVSRTSGLSSAGPASEDRSEFDTEPPSWRGAPWRRLWRTFEDVDRFLTDVNAGTRPISRRRGS